MESWGIKRGWIRKIFLTTEDKGLQAMESFNYIEQSLCRDSRLNV